MQTPQFNEKKAVKMAAIFIKCQGEPIDYIKLTELMYLADRNALLSWERSITGDSYMMSTNKVPVLSTTLSLIEDAQTLESLWAKFITQSTNTCEVTLAQACTIKALSEAEEELVKEVFQAYGHFSSSQLVDFVRKLPEWKNLGCHKSLPLSPRQIFEGAGFSEADITDIEQEIGSLNLAKSMMGCR